MRKLMLVVAVAVAVLAQSPLMAETHEVPAGGQSQGRREALSPQDPRVKQELRNSCQAFRDLERAGTASSSSSSPGFLSGSISPSLY